MKSPQYKQEETTSIIQRLIKEKQLTHEIYMNSLNKTAEKRRLNEFYKMEQERKENK